MACDLCRYGTPVWERAKKRFKKTFKKLLTASEGHVIMYLEATGTLQIKNNGGVRYDRKKICKGIS
jgi:hypothetical protein